MMKKTLYLRDMHCKACEVRIKQICHTLPWCRITSVSHKTWQVDIEYTKKTHIHTIQQQLDEEFIVSEQPPTIKNYRYSKKDRVHLFAVILVWWLSLWLLSTLNIMREMSFLTSNISFSIAVLLGVVASVSTCLAVTGWIIIAFSKYADDTQTQQWHIRTQLLFQWWRILWFFVWWAILWWVGTIFQISLTSTAILNTIVAIVMIYLWLHILKIIPTFSIWLPDTVSRWMSTRTNPGFAPLVWALTFLLPCGFTQTVQIAALSSGDRLTAWLMMALFAVGTAPVLFSVGLGSRWIKDQSFGLFHIIAWCVIVAFGGFTLTNSVNLIWRPSSNTDQWDISQKNNSDELERITIVHDWRQIEDWTIELDAGKDYELTINPTNNGIWCMSAMVIPSLWERTPRSIRKNNPITYNFENMQQWTYQIVCSSMWMSMGEIIVQ